MSGAGAASGAGGNGDGRKFMNDKVEAMWRRMQADLKQAPDIMNTRKQVLDDGDKVLDDGDKMTISIVEAEDVAETVLPDFATYVATQQFHGKEVTLKDPFIRSLCVSLVSAVENHGGPSYELKDLCKNIEKAETPDMDALHKLYKLVFKHVCAVLLPNAGHANVVVISDSEADSD